MRISFFIIMIGLSIGFCQIALSQSSLTDTCGGYKLVWADEFNKEGPPDTANWKFEKGFVRNHEDQWYQAQNAVCHNGLLIIKAQRVHLANPDYVPQSTNWKTNRSLLNIPRPV